MANKIILPVYKMAVSVFINTFKKGGQRKKFVFQCELKNISNNDATFGLVAYPANKKNGKWEFDSPIKLVEDTSKPPYIFIPPIIFGNNELVPKTKPLGGAVAKYKAGSIYRKLRAMARSKKTLKGLELIFTPKISKNPHVYYEVAIGTSVEAANPSPPANPY